MDFEPPSNRSLKRRLRRSTAALARDPQNPDIMVEMADILLQLDRRHEAISCYQTAAQLYIRRRSLDQATAACHKILMEDPEHKKAHQMLEEVVAREVQLDTYEDEYDPASLDIGPQEEGGNQMYAWQENTPVDDPTTLDEQEEERPDMGDAIHPPSPDAWNPLASVTLEVDDLDVLSEQTLDEVRDPSLTEDQLAALDQDVIVPPHDLMVHGDGETVSPVMSAQPDPTGPFHPVVSRGRVALPLAQDLQSEGEFPMLSQRMPFPSEFRAEGRLVEVAEGELILEEHESSNDLYLLIRGRVEVSKATRAHFGQSETRASLAVLEAESCFGELSLLGDSRRHASVRALEPCSLLAFSKDQVRDLMRQLPAVDRALRKLFRERLQENLMRLCAPVRALPRSKAREVIGGCRPLRFPPGKEVIAEGEEVSGLFLVLLGQLEVTRRVGPEQIPMLLHRLSDGDFFGGISLVLGKPSPAAIRAFTFVQLLYMPPKRYEEIARVEPGFLAAVREAALRRDRGYQSIMAGEALYEEGTTVYFLDRKKD